MHAASLDQSMVSTLGHLALAALAGAPPTGPSSGPAGPNWTTRSRKTHDITMASMVSKGIDITCLAWRNMRSASYRRRAREIGTKTAVDHPKDEETNGAALRGGGDD
ncbi:acetyl-CoA carboxylase 1-like [Dorcoceras hygrometricum]|uniref:Acetyl-CoA carboxylase 1-like n=1 Tax=Dorcoceras hygrometricum TaxID=472368 RepID=A0A2Z7ATG4_9LAMI|nr:acetyl-CoA carboxylase 1-like [Dorcoceras hygrometricum]